MTTSDHPIGQRFQILAAVFRQQAGEPANRGVGSQAPGIQHSVGEQCGHRSRGDLAFALFISGVFFDTQRWTGRQRRWDEVPTSVGDQWLQMSGGSRGHHTRARTVAESQTVDRHIPPG
ncbi:hypothetical protein OIE74_33720 [Streptomyces sp. NBC_01716]|nr:hypothetical protein [Streptomyces sp. NBC_01716]